MTITRGNRRMTAASDPSPIPPHAVTMWTDDRSIFVALPLTKGGPPYITSYPLHEGGLSAAINILRKRRAEVASEGNLLDFTSVPHPAIKRSKAQEKLYAETTEGQRANAMRVLARLGIKS